MAKVQEDHEVMPNQILTCYDAKSSAPDITRVHNPTPECAYRLPKREQRLSIEDPE